MMTNDLKNYIKESCGNLSVGIAPVDDMSPQDLQEITNVNTILAKYSPLTSAEAPVFQPRDFLENAASIIVLGFNFYFGRINLPGSPPRSEIMNFYVNPESLTYIASQTQMVIDFLSEQGFNAMQVASGVPVKIMAARSGLGAYGKNGIIQTPSLGSWIGLNMIVTDAPLEFDQPLDDPCGTCNLCREACPTGALDEPYKCNIERCVTLHTVMNKGEIPYEIREKVGTCIAQCYKCLDACPKNKKLSVQTEIANPEDLVYPEIAPLVNITADAYQKMFGDTFFEFMFMDKKYIQRNAAIALGNYGDPEYIPVLVEALETQPEELVRGAAAWSLGRIGTNDAKAALNKYLVQSLSASVRSEVRRALDSMN